MTDWSSRSQKASVRDYQLDARGPRRNAIFLPGWDEEANRGCLCITRALETGLIDKRTRIIAVERRSDIVDQIGRKLKRFGFLTPPRLHHGELHDLALAPKTKIDFAMFDLLGNLTEPLGRWFSDQLSPHLADRATLSFTFTERWRRNGFLNRCIIQWRQPAYRRLAIDYARHHELDRYILFHVIMMKTCFADFDFDYRRAQRYRDNIRVMCGFRFDNFVRVNERIWPNLSELLNDPTHRRLAA